MSRSTRTVAAALIVPALVIALAACGKNNDSGTSDSKKQAGATTTKTGPGVTESTITLGLLSDLSGPFAPLTIPIVHAQQLYWNERNDAGGVCGRKVELVVKDYGYDVQKGVVQYRALAPDVAAIQQLAGSPLTTALLPSLQKDRMLSVLAAWPSSLLGTDFVIEVGTTYDIEVINGLDHLSDQGKIASGDKLGHLYFEGEYGENGLKGTEAYAKENGMSVVKQKIQPTDEDMSGQVAAFRRAGVKAIVVTTAPTQMASLAGIAAAQGLNVAIVGNTPTYDPALLKTPAAKALKASAMIVGSVLPYASRTPENAKIAKAFRAAYPKDTPKASVQFGYASSRVMHEVLNRACENGDLSRDGLVTAARGISGLKTDGLVAGDLDYSRLGEPSTRAVFISKPADVPGGLRPIGPAKVSNFAQDYDVNAE